MNKSETKYTYRIEDLQIYSEKTMPAIREFMTMFYGRNYVIDWITDYDTSKDQYIPRITTDCNCDVFFKKFNEMFPDCKITKKTEVTTTTVDTTEEELG